MMSVHFTKKMNALVDTVKQEKWVYDAIVLLSGGKDSGYLLHYVKEKLGLRPLAFSCVHTLVNSTAAENMQKIADKIGVDLIKFTPDEDVFRKVLGHTLMTAHDRGMDENAGCGGCSFFPINTSLMLAIKMNIPLVFTGLDINQSETPVFVDSEMMKDGFKNKTVINAPIYDVAKEVLGAEYEKSIYQYDWDEISESRFPALIAPFTFIDYDFRSNYDLFTDLGLDADSFKTAFTNCDAVPFLSYVSLKRYDCLTYIRHYASEIRNGYPTFMQSKDEHEKAEALSKNTIEKLIREYESAISFVVQRDIDNVNITDSIKDEIFAIAKTHTEIYGPQVLEEFLRQILKVNEYGRFFEVDFNKIEPAWKQTVEVEA